MSWIILALTLGASITSIIHGVFMLFGSLAISGAAIPGIPSTMLAALPVISAVFALTGGIIAFNQIKWGALFLFVATGMCAPSRDTWLYGGLYFFAALLCFFLKAPKREDYYEEYDDEDENNYSGGDGEDFYYETEEIGPEKFSDEPVHVSSMPVRDIDLSVLDDDITLGVNNNEAPKVRRRTSKICPECGATVSREDRYCPNCGSKLFVPTVQPVERPEIDIPEPLGLRKDDSDTEMSQINEQLLTPINAQGNTQTEIPEINSEPEHEEQEQENFSAVNFKMNDGDDYMSSARVLVKPARDPQRRNSAMSSEAASSYQEFSKSQYTRRGKKRRRSAGRKILSMLLLVAAVGGALYFLLGLRKLPPGDLPPMVRTDVIPASERPATPNTAPANNEEIAEPIEVAVAENILPNFTPDRIPTSGVIIGSNVNVRADHSTSSNRITRLNVGSRVQVLGSFNVTTGQYTGIWYNIMTGNREGWVYGRYLQPLGSGLPSGYSNALLRTFGTTRSQLSENLGNASRATGATSEWPGLTATFRGEEVTRIRLTSPTRELQNGLKTGMSQTALNQILGYPSSVKDRTMNYDEDGKTGVVVQLDRNNSISSITVSEIQ